MRVSLDTNVLLRLVVGDDKDQQQSAVDVLESAQLVAVSVIAFCEFAWVLDRRYGACRADIGAAIRHVLTMRNLTANRPTIEAGLRMLEEGGDFADGVIAFDGKWLGAETFLSFDRQAVKILKEHGETAILLK